MKRLFLTAIITGGLVSSSWAEPQSGGDKTAPNHYTKQLQKTPAAELGAKATELILAADKKERETTTVSVVKAAVGLNPASAPAIVGAIAHKIPAMAAIAAKTAVSLEPKQTAAIARAAVSSAPEMTGKIIEALCHEYPASFRVVALAAAQIEPRRTAEILDGIGNGLPAIKSTLAKVGAEAGSGATVETILNQINEPVVVTPTPVATGLRGPTIQGPYIPLSSPPTNAPPGGGEVPPGGRDYSRP